MYVVITFDGVRGWTKDGVTEALPRWAAEREPGSGVFSSEDGDVLFVQVTGKEPPWFEDEDCSDP